jgi:hypothetical protein
LMLFLHCWWTLNSWGDESKSMRNTEREGIDCHVVACCMSTVDGVWERDDVKGNPTYSYVCTRLLPPKTFCIALLLDWHEHRAPPTNLNALSLIRCREPRCTLCVPS